MSNCQISSREPPKILQFDMEVGLHHIARVSLILMLFSLFHELFCATWFFFLHHVFKAVLTRSFRVTFFLLMGACQPTNLAMAHYAVDRSIINYWCSRLFVSVSVARKPTLSGCNDRRSSVKSPFLLHHCRCKGACPEWPWSSPFPCAWPA